VRKDDRRIDADSTSLVAKWVCDVLVEKGYLVDDDKVRFIFEPPKLAQRQQNEMMIHLKIKLKERYTMTHEELKDKVARLHELLDGLDEKWVKTKSKEVRKLLTELRQGAPAAKKARG